MAYFKKYLGLNLVFIQEVPVFVSYKLRSGTLLTVPDMFLRLCSVFLSICLMLQVNGEEGDPTLNEDSLGNLAD